MWYVISARARYKIILYLDSGNSHSEPQSEDSKDFDTQAIQTGLNPNFKIIADLNINGMFSGYMPL